MMIKLVVIICRINWPRVKDPQLSNWVAEHLQLTKRWLELMLIPIWESAAFLATYGAQNSTAQHALNCSTRSIILPELHRSFFSNKAKPEKNNLSCVMLDFAVVVVAEVFCPRDRKPGCDVIIKNSSFCRDLGFPISCGFHKVFA